MTNEAERGDVATMANTTLKILSIDEKRITTDLDKAGYRKIGAQMFQATSLAKPKTLSSLTTSVSLLLTTTSKKLML